MADAAGSGIRERKKVRTREALVEAATALCLRNGFDNTTVEQIAAAADVSTRTFSRYFSNKGAVIAAIADDMDVFIGTALSEQPTDINEYEAVHLISDTWTVMFATSFDGLGLPGNDPIEPTVLCDRLCATFEMFRRSWSPWNGPQHGQPPASAPG